MVLTSSGYVFVQIVPMGDPIQIHGVRDASNLKTECLTNEVVPGPLVIFERDKFPDESVTKFI